MTDIDEIDAVRRLRTTDEPSDAVRSAASDRLKRRIDATLTGRRGSREPGELVGPGWRRARRPVGLVGAAALVAVGVLVVVALGGGGGGSRLVAPADAAQALSQVAGVAAGRDDAALRPGEYWYVQARSRYLGTFGDRPPFSVLGGAELRETWTDREGRGRYSRTLTGHSEFLGPRDERRWRLAGRPQLDPALPASEVGTSGADGFAVGASTLSYEQLAALPTDGDAMYRRLLELAGDAGPSPDEEVFTIIGDLLRSDPIPPRVRAGLYRAAAYIKGISLVGPVTDSLGRRGVAVELESHDMRRRLVFDPHTALLLAEQDVLARRVSYIDARPGTVIGDRVAVRQAIVADDHSRPR